MLEGTTDLGSEGLLALADALRTPLLQLRVNSELVQNPDDIRVITDYALRDIDALITSLRARRDAQLELIPVSLGAVLAEVARSTTDYVRLAGRHVVVDDHSRHQLVLGEPSVLVASLELATRSMSDVPTDNPDATLILRADTRNGYPRVGVYRNDVDLCSADVHLAQKLFGGASVNAGLFHQLGALRLRVANALLQPMSAVMRSTKSAGYHGLAVRLLPSTQAGLL